MADRNLINSGRTKQKLVQAASLAALLFSAPSSAVAIPIITSSTGQVVEDAAVEFEVLLDFNTSTSTFPRNPYWSLPGVQMAKRFQGQTVTIGGVARKSELLSDTPNIPLALEPMFDFSDSLALVDFGESPQVFGRVPSSVGEGSISLLFDVPQSALGFEIVGGNGGNTFVQLFTPSGMLLDMVTIAQLPSISDVNLRTAAGRRIKGVSVYSDDAAGIGIDNLRFVAVPEPASLVMLLAGLGWMLIAQATKRFRANHSPSRAFAARATPVV